MPKPDSADPGIGLNTLNPRTPNSSNLEPEIEPDTPQPIDPPEVPPKQDVERPAKPPGRASAAPAGTVPEQPPDNKMMPSDNPNKGLNSYMDE